MMASKDPSFAGNRKVGIPEEPPSPLLAPRRRSTRAARVGALGDRSKLERMPHPRRHLLESRRGGGRPGPIEEALSTDGVGEGRVERLRRRVPTPGVADHRGCFKPSLGVGRSQRAQHRQQLRRSVVDSRAAPDQARQDALVILLLVIGDVQRRHVLSGQPASACDLNERRAESHSKDGDRAADPHRPSGVRPHIRKPSSGGDLVQHDAKAGVSGDRQLQGVGRIRIIRQADAVAGKVQMHSCSVSALKGRPRRFRDNGPTGPRPAQPRPDRSGQSQSVWSLWDRGLNDEALVRPDPPHERASPTRERRTRRSPA